MTSPATRRLLAHRPPDGFIGRDTELARLVSLAKDGRSATLLTPPSAGSSELLRQTYDRLFFDQTEIIPIYFEISRKDGSARASATRFAQEMLVQTAAFRQKDPELLLTSPDGPDVLRLLSSADAVWAEPLSAQLDEGIRNTAPIIATPVRAAVGGVRMFVMIDGSFEAAGLNGGDEFLETIYRAAEHPAATFVIAGPRRFLYAKTRLISMRIDRLAHPDAATLVKELADESAVGINEETRDLIALQLASSPVHITSVMTTAAENNLELTSFGSFESLYTDELFDGRIGQYLNERLTSIAREGATKLASALTQLSQEGTDITHFRELIEIDAADLGPAVQRLHELEVINLQHGKIMTAGPDIVWKDYLATRAALASGTPRASLVGKALVSNMVRAPRLMAAFYRREASIGLKAVLASFQGQTVPEALIDHGRLKAAYRGSGDETILEKIRSDPETVVLPAIVYAVNTSAIYPRLDEQIEPERSATGFCKETVDGPAVVMAVEIDSKLEATRDVAEFWLDRLDMVALANNIDRYRLWLIAPEGFDDTALEAIRERGAWGTSRKQVELLRELIKPGQADTAPPVEPADEYEAVVPMGEDGEILSARTLDDIGRRHNIPSKVVNQVKTAVVEACINASEHSLSPDRQIYQRFVVGNGNLKVTISNRGLRLADTPVRLVTEDAGRRGWGLKLMRGLMDDVRIEDTDDGTRITMEKKYA